MKTKLTIIGLLATLAANGQNTLGYLTNQIIPWNEVWPPRSYAIPMPTYPVNPPTLVSPTTDWANNLMFNGREIGFRSDGVVVWRLVPERSITATNILDIGALIITNRNVMTNGYTYYTNIILGDILDNAVKPGDLFRARSNGEPVYISFEGVTNLTQLDEKIGHVWKYTNLKNRRCILCNKLVTLWEEWK